MKSTINHEQAKDGVRWDEGMRTAVDGLRTKLGELSLDRDADVLKYLPYATGRYLPGSLQLPI